MGRAPDGRRSSQPSKAAEFSSQFSSQFSSDLAHELVVFGAHYDSVNWQDTSGPAPGVDDNGSGMAAVLGDLLKRIEGCPQLLLVLGERPRGAHQHLDGHADLRGEDQQ